MSVSATEGVNPGLMSPAAASGVGTSTGLGDQQMFMELMVAQLRYQDPLNPADSGEFLAQSAQFTALEKMQDVADQTAMLLTTQMAFGASSLIGQTVRWTDAEGNEMSGVVEGTTFLPSGPVLAIGDEQVPLINVVSVGEAPTIQPEDVSGDVTTDPPSGTV